MSSAAVALSWEILARHRWWFRVFGAYLAIACLVVPFLPDTWRNPNLGVFLAMPAAILGFVPLLGYEGGGDMRLAGGGFPRRLYTLPTSSFVLASTQFGLATLLLAGLWLVAAVGLLRPCRAEVPVVLPALAIAACVGWLLALSWSPFPLPWLRFALVCAFLIALGALPLALAESWVSPGTATAVLAPSLPVAYLVAWNGVRLGRRGVGATEPSLEPTAAPAAPLINLTPFSSAFRAQLSLELRYARWAAIWMFLMQALVILPCVHMSEFVWRRPYYLEAAGPTAVLIGPAWLSLLLFLMMPFSFAFLGADSSPHVVSQRGGMPVFFATRAVSATTIALAKVASKAILLGILWAELLFLAGGWALLGGHLGDMVERAGPAVIAGGIVSLILVNWLVMIGGVWVGMTGRPWVFLVVVVTATGLGVLAAPAWKGYEPSWHPWLVALVAVALASKVAVTAWVCRRLVARRLAAAPALAAILAAWVGVVVPIAAFASYLFPGGWLTALAVAQLVPLAQTLAAPLALTWNRHR